MASRNDMAKKFKDEVAETEQYLAFLRKRLDSKNYKANVPPEEYAKTKEKYERAKFRLRILTMKKK